MKEKYVLWLASWYPTEIAPYDGDFVQRHAKAVSIYKEVVVVFIKKDVNSMITNSKKTIKTQKNNLTEIIFYYRPWTCGIKLIDKAVSFINYQIFYYKAIKDLITEKGNPLLIHVHVIKQVALVCLMLKRNYKIPFVISEHWTGFLHGVKKSFKNHNPIYKRLCRRLFRSAEKVTVVSDVLGKSIGDHFGIKNYSVVQNVVDTTIFFPIYTPKINSTIFVHISNGTEQKNILKMLKAFSLVKESNQDFVLHLFAPVKSDILELIQQLHLYNNVILHGEEPQNKLAIVLQQADALVLFSDYETFGCVVIEANAVGVPAILSDLPVFREYAIEKETCLFASSNSLEDCAAAIDYFIKNKDLFDKSKIAKRTSSLFSFEVIGEKFNTIYESLI